MTTSSTDPRHGKQTIKSERPWGDVYMVVRNQECSVDLTFVRPGERASLHSHKNRHELFHFLDDGAHLELDGQILHPNIHDEYLISPCVRHRFWADDKPFRMLVVSFGKWQAEDQKRFEDDYGREGKKLKL